MLGWFTKSLSGAASDIGVDLGTANTLVCVRRKGVVLNEPSVVAVERDTRKMLAVGLDAKRMLGRTPRSIAAIRPLRNGVIADVDVAEIMLRHFLKQVMANRFIRIRPRVVVGVPSGITELERRGVRTAAQAAGANEVYVVAEPMAAAIGLGLPIHSPRGSMVIDIGGGTTEIAVIALSGMVCQKSIRVGGDTIDRAIVDFVRQHYNVLIGEPTAEAIKIQIGSAVETDDEREMEVRGRDLVSGIPKVILLHSHEVRECMSGPIRPIVQEVRNALEITPPELVADIIEQGIVMTGGGASIRGLADLVSLETNVAIHVDDEPLTCVVRGTSTILEDFDRYQIVLDA